MKSSIEDILDKALKELRRGQTADEVLSAFPEYAAELQPLLKIAAMGLSIPRNIVPTPMRRHRFAERQYQSWWLNTVSLLKFGVVPLTLVFVLLGGKTLASKTEQSRPSDTLFTLKRASEQLQLKFTRDANQQAAFQVQLTQRRIDEVKQASSPEQEAAALAELKDQSQKTFATVPQVAAAAALASKDSTLLDSLLAINKEQQEVLTAVQDDTALKTAVENGQTLAAIVATVQEQTLADFENKISMTGDAAIAADKTTVTIDKTVFTITEDTLITGPDGQDLDPAKLPAKAKANVVGVKTDTGVTAKIISLISIEPADDTAPATPAPTKKPADPATPPPATPVPDSSNQVTSGVIAEPAGLGPNPSNR